MATSPGVGEVAWTYCGAWIAHDDLLFSIVRSTSRLFIDEFSPKALTSARCATNLSKNKSDGKERVEKGEKTQAHHHYTANHAEPF